MSSSHSLLSRDPIDSHYLTIDSYQPNEVIIANQQYTHSILITPTEIITWAVSSIQDLSAQSLQPILELTPDLLILGTGETFTLIAPEKLQSLYQARIAVECMNNSSACRTH